MWKLRKINRKNLVNQRPAISWNGIGNLPARGKRTKSQLVAHQTSSLYLIRINFASGLYSTDWFASDFANIFDYSSDAYCVCCYHLPFFCVSFFLALFASTAKFYYQWTVRPMIIGVICTKMCCLCNVFWVFL